MQAAARRAAPLVAAICLAAVVAACSGEDAVPPAGAADGAQTAPGAGADADPGSETGAPPLPPPLSSAELTVQAGPSIPADPLAPQGVAALPAGGLEEPEGGFLSPENQLRIMLFFPSASGAWLVPEERIIFRTDTLTSQVKQAVSELLAGPRTGGLLAPFPEGTELHGVFVPGTGVAVIDLGTRVLSLPHGSDGEQTGLFSLVNTVVHNFPEVHQVQVLVEGQELETLGGHLDTSRPVRADMRRVDWVFQRTLDEEGLFEPHDIGPGTPEGWEPPPPLPVDEEPPPPFEPRPSIFDALQADEPAGTPAPGEGDHKAPPAVSRTLG